MRLFVAVYPPPDVCADLTALVSRLAIGAPRGPGESLRLVPAERWHLTLAFLGEVPDGREPAVRSAITTAVAGSSPFRLSLGGAGRFGRGRFTTVWVGVGGEVAALRTLAEDVVRELRRARIPFDAKPLKPHLTLARPADRLPQAELAADLTALDGYTGPDWTVGEVELVRSHLGPEIRYDRRSEHPLGVVGCRDTPSARG